MEQWLLQLLLFLGNMNMAEANGLLANIQQYWSGNRGGLAASQESSLLNNRPQAAPVDRFGSKILPPTLEMEGGINGGIDWKDGRPRPWVVKNGMDSRYRWDQGAGSAIRTLMMSDDDIKNTYEDEYWVKPHFDIIRDNNVARKAFDMSVNMGPGAASKTLQQALKEMGLYPHKLDNFMGNNANTGIEEAIATGRKNELLENISAFQTAHYFKAVKEDPYKEKYINGWLQNRVAHELPNQYEPAKISARPHNNQPDYKSPLAQKPNGKFNTKGVVGAPLPHPTPKGLGLK